MKNAWLRWGLVFLWCSMIYYFTESPAFTGEHTASIIRYIVQKLQLKHVNNISDGFLSWNYIIRKLAHLSVFGMLAFLAWKAMYPRSSIVNYITSIFHFKKRRLQNTVFSAISSQKVTSFKQ
ncbi:VanZ family protein [Bacillus alveayuensis]|uniref:VanZ family protein n=1 Tax=Aeribacillus alveayuensis TaxID=279215 RepID=UPI00069898BB|nr:VanZ family protein [Bacillus alveayuensis]